MTSNGMSATNIRSGYRIWHSVLGSGQLPRDETLTRTLLIELLTERIAVVNFE